jgi:hypothetical protein
MGAPSFSPYQSPFTNHLSPSSSSLCAFASLADVAKGGNGAKSALREIFWRKNFFSDLAATQAIKAAMTSWQKLSLLAAAVSLFPFFVLAQEPAIKYHYDGIYKGTVSLDLLVNGNDKSRAKAQAVFYPDGRLLVLTVESAQVRNPMNIKGTLQKNVFTGDWKRGFFGEALSFQAIFHGGSATVSVTGKNKKPEKWYFTKVSGA